MPKRPCPPIGWMLLDLGFATVRRVTQVAVDTCQEWKRVCEEQEREDRITVKATEAYRAARVVSGTECEETESAKRREEEERDGVHCEPD